MKRQLQGLALLLLAILLTLAYGNEYVFDLSHRWCDIFLLVGIIGVAMTFIQTSKDK